VLLVDANVLIDITTRDPDWAGWSEAQLASALAAGDVGINEIIFAELSVGFDRFDEVRLVVDSLQLVMLPLSEQVCFRAGQAFANYRHQGGRRANVLSDFFIGAHAELLHVPVLTRDTRRFRAYFPTVALITP